MKHFTSQALLALLILCSASVATRAQNSENFAVAASAAVQINPNRVTITWVADPLATHYVVLRRIYNSGDDFTQLDTVKAKDSAYVDKNIQIGQRYEYQLAKTFVANATEFQSYGYIAVGVQAPLIDKMGGVILLVDSMIATPLRAELDRYEEDLIGDGWFVIKHVVGRSAKVTDIKAMLYKDYLLDSANTRSLFIFGHVPVPYSGLLHPDAHPNHLGAWPADVYYGNFDGDWTDNVVNDTTTVLARPGQRNVKGDGKFDQSTINAPMNLEVGRVDLWGMTVFPKSDTELLRQYLNKDHAFRMQTLTAPSRALISDNFGAIIGNHDAEAFAADAWRTFPAFFGISNTHVLDWFSTLDTAAYLCAYGCGGGSFTSAGGIGQTADFATKDSKAIFTMMFGSYFGDWDIENNFLRAPLCTTYGLTSCWSGRPHWVFHPMTLGEPIGVCARIVEDSGVAYLPLSYQGWNNNYARDDYNDVSTFVSAELLGDPTLKLYYPMPIAKQGATLLGQKTIQLTWTPTGEAGVTGANLYRAPSSSGPFSLINSKLITTNAYIDTARYADSNFYMIRSVKLIQTASGSYYAASEGKVMQINGVSGVVTSPELATGLTVKQSASRITVVVTNPSETSGQIAIYDVLGREVAIVHDGPIQRGASNFGWDLRTQNGSIATSGTYFVRLTGTGIAVTTKLNLSR